MRMNRGIEPRGKGWKAVAYLPEWAIWVMRLSEDACLVKATARTPREGTANIMVAWDIRDRKLISVSRGTGMALAKMRKELPGLCTGIEDVLFSESFSDMPAETPKPRRDYSPKGEGWFVIEGFKSEGWKLWAKDGQGPWYNLKLVSTVRRSKMTFWLAWNVDEKRFAGSNESETLRNYIIYDDLVEFLSR